MTAPAMGLSHAVALDLAAAAPAFPLSAEESRDLAAHLRACADCARRAARLRTDLASIGAVDPALSPRLHDRLREVAVTAPRSGPSALGVVLVLALLAVGIVGASLGVGALAAHPDTPRSASLDPRPDTVRVDTGVVLLTAKELAVDIGGEHIVPSSADWTSDGAEPDRWTLELRWPEGGRTLGLKLDFASDATTWWVQTMSLYDSGMDKTRQDVWTPLDGGPWAKTARGGAFAGDITGTAQDRRGQVRVSIVGATLASNPRAPLGDPNGIAGRKGGTPTQREIACSGALQLPPLAAAGRLAAMGAVVDWRWQYATGANTGMSEVRTSPPTTGFISGIAPGAGTSVVVFVEDPDRPSMPAATLPPDCPAP